jgi:hypothetical protein
MVCVKDDIPEPAVSSIPPGQPALSAEQVTSPRLSDDEHPSRQGDPEEYPSLPDEAEDTPSSERLLNARRGSMDIEEEQSDHGESDEEVMDIEEEQSDHGESYEEVMAESPHLKAPRSPIFYDNPSPLIFDDSYSAHSAPPRINPLPKAPPIRDTPEFTPSTERLLEEIRPKRRDNFDFKRNNKNWVSLL